MDKVKLFAYYLFSLLLGSLITSYTLYSQKVIAYKTYSEFLNIGTLVFLLFLIAFSFLLSHFHDKVFKGFSPFKVFLYQACFYLIIFGVPSFLIVIV